MKIFLIGLPGSGKSTLGKELAGELNVLFVDLDAEIEKECGKRISEIFKEHGEDYFRKLESIHLKKWIVSPISFVLATGGGTPCFFDHMQVINASGKSIFMDVPVEEIVRRIAMTPREDRPLVGPWQPDEIKSQMELMRSARLTFYQQAHITLSGPRITLPELRSLIV